MPVNTQHPEYKDHSNRWKKVRDCVKGEEAVKAASTEYLPKPNPSDLSQENKDRYEQYLKRAMFLEVTGRTEQGLLGAIFRKPSTYELPTPIEYLVEDSDGSGQSLEQLAKWCCSELLQVGRAGILTDYTNGPEARTQAEALQQNRRAFLLPYRSESIINWHYTKIGNVYRLSMIVLEEEIEVATDFFEVKYEKQYRALLLDQEGWYYQQVYNDKQELVGEPIYPTMADGSKWTYIPFQILGAIDNQPGTDVAPLNSLAVVNIGHYRNSADYEEGVYLHGQGTLFISLGNMPASTFTEMNPNGVLIGARKGIVLGENGTASLLQMGANSAAYEAMQAKEQQMIAIGARLITAKTGTQTAEEARINASGESSVLSNLVGNVSEGIEAALEQVCFFTGADPEKVQYLINEQFFDSPYDPQEAIAKMAELDRGLIAKKDYRDWLRRTGNINENRTDEDIDAEVETEPAGPNLDA